MADKENMSNINAAARNSINAENTVDLPEGPKYDAKGAIVEGSNFDPLVGKPSMLNTLSVLHYNDMFNASPNMHPDSLNVEKSRYFLDNKATGYRNPSGSNIVSTFNEAAVDHAMQYKWGDFLYLDNYGKVPNNHLITLRRFPNPSNDNLLSNLQNPNRDTARLLTYIDGEDNKFEKVFSFSAGFEWKKFKSEIQTIQKSKTGWSSMDFLGYADTSGKFAQEKLRGKAATEFNPYADHANNYTFGPIDVIDNVTARTTGLNFSQNMTLKFRYAVKSYDGISTKAAFLDIIGNMLTMTTNKAPFWGGAVRMIGGGGFSGPMGDADMLKNGDVAGWMDSFVVDLAKKVSAPFKGGDIMKGIKTMTGNIAASMFGGKLEKMGRPEKFSLYSLLTGTPTGEWHLTIGNPFNPAMMFGNLIMKDASFSMEGPFTADDVPSYVNLEIKLEHAMPRDKFAIQRMFNFGGTRFYGSNTDYDAKSYYRNKDNGAGTPSGNIGIKIVDSTVKNAEGKASSAMKVASSKYQKFVRQD